MWTENQIFKEDLEYINNVNFVDWKKLENKTVLVTGGTGLIGYYFINALLFRNLTMQSNITVVALVRNLDKAKTMYKEQLETDCNLKFVVGDVEKLPPIEEQIDFIMHGASPTASNFFVEYPVETIKTAVQGTINMFELAKKKKAQGFVYLSSMEVYGAPKTDDLITENQGTTVDTMSVRSCYPEAKRMCEALCVSYASEYGVPANAIRLAQTFGPGVPKDDNRVFAEFARCAVQGKDIVLQTAGTSKRCYLYNADAVTSILTIMTAEVKGEIYNAANSNTYCSIVDMARMVAEELGKGSVKVVVPSDGKHEHKFPPPHMLNLDSSKLKALGWKATRDLKEMYVRMVGVV